MFATLGKFQIKSRLGCGAMGEVYLGVDPAIGREVAIKTILPSAAGGAEARERFAREAKAAGTLNHPNIVTVYEFGEDQGVMYIAMEYVPGSDLEELITGQTLTRIEFLEVLAQVCDGLDYAHQHHIVHRDIKPANIRVQREGKRLYTRVMDFGVARVGNSDMTATGMVMGTVSYMAPEYIQTGRPDARSDIFAVGVMLYEALSGRKPFAGDTTPTILYKIVNNAPEPLDLSHFEGISPAIRHVLDRGLDKDPEQRFQTAEEFAKALRAAKNPTWQAQTSPPAAVASEAEQTVHLRPVPAALPQAHSPKSGTRGIWIAAAAAVLAGVSLGAWNLMRPKVEPGPTPLTTTSPQVEPKPAKPSEGTEPPLAPIRVEAPLPVSSGESRLEVRTQESIRFSEQSQVRTPARDRESPPLPPFQPKPPLSPQVPNAGPGLNGNQRPLLQAPSSVEAYAEGIILAYREGRFGECRSLFRRARRQGLGPQVAAHAGIRQILAEERAKPRVPGGLGRED